MSMSLNRSNFYKSRWLGKLPLGLFTNWKWSSIWTQHLR